MRKSKMETEEFLGPFPATLQVDNYQHMVYQDGDVGPFFKTDVEQQASEFDNLTGVRKER
jgi:hypothetical protein